MYRMCFRTFPHHDFFTDGQGIGQENLFNVLKAYSMYVSFFIHMISIMTSKADMTRK